MNDHVCIIALLFQRDVHRKTQNYSGLKLEYDIASDIRGLRESM